MTVAGKRIEREARRSRGHTHGISFASALIGTPLQGISFARRIRIDISRRFLPVRTVGMTLSFASAATFLTTTAPKATTFVPPLVALTVAMSWIGSQRHSIAQVETESRVMRDRLAENLGIVASPGMPGQTIKTMWPIDWKERVSRFDDGFTRRQFRKQMEKMTLNPRRNDHDKGPGLL
jgi:hypothetical protein